MKLFKSKFVSSLLILSVVVFSSGIILIKSASASTITTFSDVLSREKASTASNHTITFTTPTGVAAGATLVLTFNNGTDTGSVAFGDVDLMDDGVDVTLAATPLGSTWGLAHTSSTVLTFTNGSAAVAAGSVVVIKIGTNATGGSNQITNGSAGTTTLVISGNFGDSGTAAMPIIAEDQVTVTATVAPTMTFSINDTSIGFGTLSSVGPRYATSDGTSAGGSGSDSVANTLAISTNGANGYSLSYLGANLTSGANTIPTGNGTTTITGDADGNVGTAEWAIGGVLTGSGSMASGYQNASSNWKFAPNATTPLASHTTATSDSIAMHYLANISGSTPSGSYSTTITYIATGNF